ncbi:MAG: hypothetical protein COA47_05850 [Robiginitomaculum sp.]|nr:MAG: hypothetical protein COA47_05850 [Robiginitomaculum sp.]
MADLDAINGGPLYSTVQSLNEHCFDADIAADITANYQTAAYATPCQNNRVTTGYRGNVIVQERRDFFVPAGGSTASLGWRPTYYNYNILGQLTGIVDQGDVTGTATANDDGIVWEYRYDARGNRVRSVDPDLGNWAMDYDANGNLIRQVNAAGQETTFAYDALNRVVLKEVCNDLCNSTTLEASYDYGYDDAVPTFYNIGRLTSIDGPNDDVTYNYDQTGQVKVEVHDVGSDSYEMRHRHYPNGQLRAEATIPFDGAALDYMLEFHYDDFGRPLSVIDPNSTDTYLTIGSYDIWGAPSQITYGNGIVENYTFDQQRGWLFSNHLTGINGGPPLLKDEYFRTAAGQIYLHRAPRQNVRFQYAYDHLGRLTDIASYWNAASSANDQNLAYDEYGRITTNSAVGNYVYEGTNCTTAMPHAPCKIKSLNNQAVRHNFTYDANGNMTLGLDDKVMEYDAENRITAVTLAGVRTEYVYASDGSRLLMVTDVGTANERETLTIGGLEVRDFGSNDPEHIVSPHAALRFTDGQVSYLHRNQQGSITLISDGVGHRSRERYFAPYGEEVWTSTPQPGSPEENRGWIGERHDTDAGLQFLNARYYDPRLGMFTSPDWFEVAAPGVGPNRYIYAGGDPVNGRDPNGNGYLLNLAKKILNSVSSDAVRATGRAMVRLRRSAITTAWRQEQALVRDTGQGSREWSDAALELLRSGERVPGYQGHHINSAAAHPEMAGMANNIEFLTKAEHTNLHRGNGGFQAPTSGVLIDRRDQYRRSLDRDMDRNLTDRLTLDGVMRDAAVALNTILDSRTMQIIDAFDPFTMVDQIYRQERGITYWEGLQNPEAVWYAQCARQNWEGCA